MSFLFILSGNRYKASSRVRGYWIIKQLKLKGYRANALNNHGYISLVLAFLIIPFYNNIVFQKTYSRYHLLIHKWALLLHKTTILDIDDAPSRTLSKVTLLNFSIMVNKVDLVTAGSTALLNYVRDLGANNAILIPSSIDLDLYKGGKQYSEGFTLGWIGNGKDYKDDLITIVKPLLREIGKTNSVNFLLIGVNSASELYDEFSNIPNIKTEFIDQLNWSNTALVAQQIYRMDVGLYPLLKNDFNKYKCAFKALEYMACGVPVISSNIAFNTEVIDNGVDGFIVSTSKEWLDSVNKLMLADNEIQEIRKNGLKKIHDLFSTKRATEKLLQSLKS